MRATESTDGYRRLPPAQDPANYTYFLLSVIADPDTAPRGGYERPPGSRAVPLFATVGGAQRMRASVCLAAHGVRRGVMWRLSAD